MEREIKFRAWIKDKRFGQEMFRVVMISWICKKEVILSGRGGSIGLEDCVLMQFTGLLDKNGKEIYEGDIVKFRGIVTAPNKNFGNTYEEKIEVKFKDGCFEPFNRPYSTGRDCEIIGNIYENLGLSEGGSK